MKMMIINKRWLINLDVTLIIIDQLTFLCYFHLLFPLCVLLCVWAVLYACLALPPWEMRNKAHKSTLTI